MNTSSHCGNRPLRLLLTRPSAKSEQLAFMLKPFCEALEIYPLISFSPVPITPQTLQTHIEHTQAIIFVSTPAVTYLQQAIQGNPLLEKKLNRLPLYAVGKSTAKQVENWIQKPVNYPTVHYPEVETSEGLLNEILINDKHSAALKDVMQVTIVRGNSGRETLKQTLEAKSITVSYLESYRREQNPSFSSSWLDQWKLQGINGIVVTSAEMLTFLWSVATKRSQQHWLQHLHWFVPSERVLEVLVTQYGVKKQYLHCTSGASNRCITDCITNYNARRNTQNS